MRIGTLQVVVDRGSDVCPLLEQRREKSQVSQRVTAPDPGGRPVPVNARALKPIFPTRGFLTQTQVSDTRANAAI